MADFDLSQLFAPAKPQPVAPKPKPVSLLAILGHPELSATPAQIKQQRQKPTVGMTPLMKVLDAKFGSDPAYAKSRESIAYRLQGIRAKQQAVSDAKGGPMATGINPAITRDQATFKAQQLMGEPTAPLPSTHPDRVAAFDQRKSVADSNSLIPPYSGDGTLGDLLSNAGSAAMSLPGRALTRGVLGASGTNPQGSAEILSDPTIQEGEGALGIPLMLIPGVGSAMIPAFATQVAGNVASKGPVKAAEDVASGFFPNPLEPGLTAPQRIMRGGQDILSTVGLGGLAAHGVGALKGKAPTPLEALSKHFDPEITGQKAAPVEQATPDLQKLSAHFDPEVTQSASGIPALDAVVAQMNDAISESQKNLDSAEKFGQTQKDMAKARSEVQSEHKTSKVEAKPVETPKAEPPSPSAKTEIPKGAESQTPAPSSLDIYRETSPGKILNEDYAHPDRYWASHPDLAIGQGNNKGVLVRFRPSDKAVLTENPKPGMPDDMKEYSVGRYQGTNSGKMPGDLVSLTIRKDAALPEDLAYNLKLFSDPKNPNRIYTREKLPSGDTVFHAKNSEGWKPTPEMPAQAQEAAKPVEAKPEAPKPKVSNTTGLAHQVNVRETAEGLKKVDRLPGIKPEDAHAQGKKAVETGEIEPVKLAQSIADNPRVPTQKEIGALLEGKRRLKKAVNDAMTPEEYAQAVEDLHKFGQNVKVGSNQWHQTGMALQAGTQLDTGDFASVIEHAQKLGAKVDPSTTARLRDLTAQIAEKDNQIAEMEKSHAEKTAAMEAKAQDFESKLAFAKERAASRRAASKMSIDELKGQREDILNKLTKQTAKLSAGLDPEAAKLVGQYVVNLVHSTSLKLDDVIRTAVEDFKVRGLETDYNQVRDAFVDAHKRTYQEPSEGTRKVQVMRGIAEKTRILGQVQEGQPPKGFDKNFNRIPRENKIEAAAIERLKTERAHLDMAVKTAIENKRPKTAMDWLSKIQHANIFSGPTILGKLSAASAEAGVSDFLGDMFGSPIGKITGLGKIAERESGFNAKAQGEFVKQFFLKDSYADAIQKAKTGHNSLDARYGKEKVRWNVPVLDFFGNLHGAIKTPLQRAAFEKSFKRRVDIAAARGISVADPRISEELAVKAYGDSLMSIFQNDNALTKAFSGALKNPIGRVLVPVSKVPTNIAGRLAEHVLGAPYAAVRWPIEVIKAGRAGGKIAPETADMLLRAFKRGGPGAAMFALGYLHPKEFQFSGGFAPGVKQKEGFGGLKAFGVEVPHWAVHGPFMQAGVMGATVRRALGSKGTGTDKAGAVARQSFFGLVEAIPYTRSMMDFATAFRSDKDLGKYAGGIVSGITTPQLLQSVARGTDPKKRYPRGFGDTLKMGVPGLREQVPSTKRSRGGGKSFSVGGLPGMPKGP